MVSRTSLFDVSQFDAAAPASSDDGTNHNVMLQNVPGLARRIVRGAAQLR
jgi:hypothetical protein